jgi:hypothetical protein
MELSERYHFAGAAEEDLAPPDCTMGRVASTQPEPSEFVTGEMEKQTAPAVTG